MTQRLVNAGTLLGINVVDHIIIGRDGRYFSFADEGLLDEEIVHIDVFRFQLSLRVQPPIMVTHRWFRADRK